LGADFLFHKFSERTRNDFTTLIVHATPASLSLFLADDDARVAWIESPLGTIQQKIQILKYDRTDESGFALRLLHSLALLPDLRRLFAGRTAANRTTHNVPQRIGWVELVLLVGKIVEVLAFLQVSSLRVAGPRE